MEHEFERNARTAEAEQSKRAASRVKPIPDLSEKEKEKLEKTAQNILDVRKEYSSWSFAELYDDVTMPSKLRKAHQENDRAVWEAYGKKWELGNEEECVAYLMKLYKDLVEK